ncbi:MAG: MgtC/SapB family protein [Planctomycetales bacterium]|nr:MgtC/SapB family protein [Planctomycetales bacterium]
MDLLLVEQLAIALGLGLLVGFQREWTAPHVAGLRTFALITVFGTVVGLFAAQTDGWLISAGLLAVAAMVIVGNVLRSAEGDEDPGLTTQAAALVMYLVGVAIAFEQMELGIIVAGGTAVLLHWKEPLHDLVERVGEQDIRAVIQLVLIGLVILPILPNRDFGPYGVLNPFEIWLMVVLIVGISLGGYLGYRWFGARAGALLGGVLGGLISSTATTISCANRSRQNPAFAGTAVVVIMIASTIVFARVLVEVALVARGILYQVAPPLGAMMCLMAIISAAAYFFSRGDDMVAAPDENPAELKVAIIFGTLYAAVLFAVAAVKQHFGTEGMYIVAGLSGLTDMDAITLSTAQMINKQRLDVDTGWRMILVGALSNLAFKATAVAVLGHRALLWRLLIAFGTALLGGILLLVFWP